MEAIQNTLQLITGLALVLCGTIFYLQLSPHREVRTFFLSYACGGVAFGLWSPSIEQAVDRSSGIPGVGLLLWMCAALWMVQLQTIFLWQITNREHRLIRVAPLILMGTVAIVGGPWIIVHLVSGRSTEYLL